ncbi:epimerase [Roseivirga sp. 4D4]|uniref:SDR family oxidoreductase n=1 Tax=Roseivirga sp. 4D4 TaxID=1889784 RepID=UPI000853AD66|nr:SDR family oxidoreductase [Roseivirga sp. 4D4]OEK02899.1 epimerase [Roseivirga sp. 4D4]
MKILLTGANGYIGKRLLHALIKEDYEVVCCVRKRKTFNHPLKDHAAVSVIEVDFLDVSSLSKIPNDIDGAFYLMHSMSGGNKKFEDTEAQIAENFVEAMAPTSVKHVVYLGGIANDEHLSKHLSSRLKTEEIIQQGEYHFTAFRAGIILGSGSASFEIMRDLVEKLPVMVAPKWLKTESQPIAVRNVLEILSRGMLNEQVFDQVYDIGGEEIMTYKQMLLRFAKVRKLKRWIYTVPVLTPRLSSYWLYFVTSTSYSLASSLVDSMSVSVVCKPNDLMKALSIDLIPFDEAIERAFTRIKQNHVVSSWKDSGAERSFYSDYDDLIEVPEFGCFKDEKSIAIKDVDKVQSNIWALGGDTGWYYGNWLWKLRGYLDKLIGGVGLRRGRTNPVEIFNGDSLDFWRVLVADKANKRLLLYAEMKLPGEAWLEFKIDKDQKLYQTATFRPHGLFGRLYWLAVLPFHYFVFNGMIRGISK